jgi:hypothetical protein
MITVLNSSPSNLGELLSADVTRILESQNFAVLIENARRKIVYANQAFSDLFCEGVDPALIVGQNCSGAADATAQLFCFPEEFMSFINRSIRVNSKGRSHSLELRKGGAVTMNYLPIESANGRIGHLWFHHFSNSDQ